MSDLNSQFKEADNERNKDHANFITCSTPTILAMVLLLSDIVTSFTRK